MPATVIRNAASLFQLGHDSFQCRQPFIDKAMIIGGAEYALGTAEQAAIMFVPGQRAIGFERVDDLRHIMEQAACDIEKASHEKWTIVICKKHRLLPRQREIFSC